MDKGLTVPKWVLIVWPKNKIPQIYLPNLSAQAQKVLSFNEKRRNWASVVSDAKYSMFTNAGGAVAFNHFQKSLISVKNMPALNF